MTETLVDNHTLHYSSNFIRLEQRNYVQGSTLVQGLLDAIKFWDLGQLEYLKIACHSMLNEQGVYELVSNDDTLNAKNKIKNSSIIFEIRCKGKEYTIVLNGNKHPVEVSIPYDEKQLTKGYSFNPEERSVDIEWTQEHPLLQVLIALNKILLDKTLMSEGHGKWIFYKSDLDWSQLHKQSGTLNLKLRATIGLKCAISDVYLNDEKLANIFFTRPEL